MSSIIISIINYRNFGKTCNLLSELALQKTDCTVKVLVLDNSETSETGLIEEFLKERNLCFPGGISLLKSDKNIGFGRGHNHNFRQVRHDPDEIFIIINNDVSLKNIFFLENLLRDIVPGVIRAPVILETETGRVWNAGGTLSPLSGDLKVRRKYDPTCSSRIDFVSGCCMVMTASTYAILGGFDEQFFMYAEDLDLCIRARLKGFYIELVPQTLFHDAGSGLRGIYSDLYLLENTKNRLICMRNHNLGVSPINLVHFVLKYVVARAIQLMIYSKSPIHQIQLVCSALVAGARSSRGLTA